jgi:hypothetical protein
MRPWPAGIFCYIARNMSSKEGTLLENGLQGPHARLTCAASACAGSLLHFERFGTATAEARCIQKEPSQYLELISGACTTKRSNVTGKSC